MQGQVHVGYMRSFRVADCLTSPDFLYMWSCSFSLNKNYALTFYMMRRDSFPPMNGKMVAFEAEKSDVWVNHISITAT